MLLLFLDIDGVLNSRMTSRADWPDELEGDLLDQLVRVVKETGANIVLSSSWRHSPQHVLRIKHRFIEAGIWNKLIDHTPDFCDEPRGYEITQWLNKNRDRGCIRYAIIDDDEDASVGHDGSFFHTNCMLGLTEANADAIIAYLCEPAAL